MAARRPERPRPQRQAAPLLLCLMLIACGGATAQEACGSLENGVGPHDYRTERGNTLRLVESVHFPPHVESLIRGNSTTLLGGDIDYTLRAFPNHHRALLSAMRHGIEKKSPQPPGMRYSVECYFIRALRFRPDDTTARMLYAMYLRQNDRLQAARDELEQVATLAGDNAFTHYNLGLMYLEAGDPERALRQAHKAFALGFRQQALKEKLVAAGQWRDPPPADSGDLPADRRADGEQALPSDNRASDAR